MQIDYTAFSPLSALLGGGLIGAAAGMLVLFQGRIAGISGILGGLMQKQARDRPWRIAFVLGLVAAPLAWQALAALPASEIEASWPLLIIAGALVGLGARYGAGCTSGHGVCGLSRLSMRSLVATLCFMGTGFVTASLLHQLV